MNKDKKLTRREMLALSGAGAATVVGASLIGDARAQSRSGAGASPPRVPRRVLGKTGKKIPILLFGGAVRLDPRFDPKLAEAMRFGVNYIDAADCYGGSRCERAVGSFLARTRSRNKVWITTKSDEHEVGPFLETVATSLKRLDTDYIDMYYLHMLRDGDHLDKDLARAVEKLKKAGKIRFFGFSCHHGNVPELLQKAAKLSWIDSVMFRYNFRKYGDRELNKAIDAAHKSKVGLIAMKTQGSAASFSKEWKKFQQTGKWTKHQAVLKAVWDDERITAAVSHMDTLDKLRQNVAAAVDKSKLTAAEKESLQRYAAETRSYACDGCDHICGARVDAPVQIGDTMRYLMYHDSYGEREKARALFHALPRAAQNLSGVDFRAGEAACPHGVKLAAHMARAAKVLAG